MRIASMLLLSLPFFAAQANELKVIQVKGSRAVVSLPEGMMAQKGDVLKISDGSSSGGSVGAGSRNTRIDFTFAYSSLTAETAFGESDTSTMELSGTYGWNKGRMEYGPKISYESTDTGSAKTTTMELGGFFEWNFTPNTSGVKLVPFVGGELAYASLDAGGAKVSGFGFAGYGGAKYFLTETISVPLFAKYGMQSLSGDGDVDISGFSLGAGVAVYW
jgi:hypothetical protein